MSKYRIRETNERGFKEFVVEARVPYNVWGRVVWECKCRATQLGDAKAYIDKRSTPDKIIEYP